MEPLKWLAVPFAVTGVVAVVLHVRDRRDAEVSPDRVREQRLRGIARALDADARSADE